MDARGYGEMCIWDNEFWVIMWNDDQLSVIQSFWWEFASNAPKTDPLVAYLPTLSKNITSKNLLQYASKYNRPRHASHINIVRNLIRQRNLYIFLRGALFEPSKLYYFKLHRCVAQDSRCSEMTQKTYPTMGRENIKQYFIFLSYYSTLR